MPQYPHLKTRGNFSFCFMGLLRGLLKKKKKNVCKAFRAHLAQSRHAISICYFHSSLYFYRMPSESFPVTSSALLKAIWQTGSHRAENGIFLGELKIMPTLFPSQLAFSCAGKGTWREGCSALQSLAGCHFSQIGEKSEAQSKASMQVMAKAASVRP